MASISMATISLRGYCSCNCSSIHRTAASVNWRLSLSSNQKGRSILQHVSKPLSAVGSGLEASITDPKDNAMNFKNAKIVVESKEEDKIQLRVDLSGDETQKVFDKVLTDLGKSAPPIPGFRRQKGGKTSKVPRDFLLQILGEERVTNFVIQEIVSSSLADYVKKENLNVKDNKVNTIQKAEELKKLFTPGTAFGFTAVLELEETKTEPSS
ncbi:uncharacterized protein LOC105628283 [Jatropha curcas]|uniref:uncharacterized protein LOC105628283 n=1 Tax=Jatropha curcas TaxID=180498 RepID=UPI0005FBBBC4|nr:uncharacterized protein LOC105628283 [Jatropha curcas]